MRRAARGARSNATVVPMGIGARAAAEAADAAIAAHARIGEMPRALVTGLCGALSPSFGIGDALLYLSITDACDPQVVTDGELTEAISCAAPGTLSGIRAFEAADVLTTPSAKRAAAERYEAQAVDMESATLVRALSAAGWRVAVLRVVADAADDALPNLNVAIDDRGRLNSGKLALACLVNPIAAVTMARNGARALNALRRVLYTALSATKL